MYEKEFFKYDLSDINQMATASGTPNAYKKMVQIVPHTINYLGIIIFYLFCPRYQPLNNEQLLKNKSTKRYKVYHRGG